MLNNEIVKYIELKFADANLDNNQKAALLEEYLNSNKPMSVIKEELDAKYNELTTTNNTISKPNESLPTIFDTSKIIMNNGKALIDLKDISDLRTSLKNNKYYDPNMDSLTYTKDGNDYGLEVTSDYKTNIKFSPILKSRNKTYLYEWNRSANTFTVKSTEEKNINDQTVFTVERERHLSDMNNVEANEMLKNALIRYSYIARNKYGKRINDDKIGEAFTRLRNKSNYEVNEILEKSLNKKNANIKQLGYAKALSLGLICIIFGCLICIIALLAG